MLKAKPRKFRYSAELELKDRPGQFSVREFVPLKMRRGSLVAVLNWKFKNGTIQYTE